VEPTSLEQLPRPAPTRDANRRDRATRSTFEQSARGSRPQVQRENSDGVVDHGIPRDRCDSGRICGTGAVPRHGECRPASDCSGRSYIDQRRLSRTVLADESTWTFTAPADSFRRKNRERADSRMICMVSTRETGGAKRQDDRRNRCDDGTVSRFERKGREGAIFLAVQAVLRSRQPLPGGLSQKCAARPSSAVVMTPAVAFEMLPSGLPKFVIEQLNNIRPGFHAGRCA